MKTEIEERALKLMVEMLGVAEEKIQPDALLIDDLNLDSIDTIDLLMRLSDDFDIDLNPMHFENCKTVSDFAVCLNKKLEEKKDKSA